MKKTTVLVPVLMVALLCLGWLAFFSGITSTKNAYNTAMDNAQASLDAGLYEQAIEYYKEALTHETSEELYMTIKETYDLFYAEEHIAYVRDCYIEDMAVAAQQYPDNPVFWEKQVEMYMETSNYKKAYATVKSARNSDVESEMLEASYQELLYMTKLGYKQYQNVVTNLNGYNVVFDGAVWKVLDDFGEELIGAYPYIGMINEDGRGLYVNDLGCRMLDANQVARAKYTEIVEEAGYYNAKTDLIPVKINGVWKYMNFQGEYLPGEYEIAGSFYGDQAAACKNGTWYLVNAAGEATATGFEDIKLDLYNCHIQNGIILAKENGKYRIYDMELQVIGDFAADDVDICVDAEGIAFCKDGLWGFADCEGNVVYEPAFAAAKSFANGYAAVANADGLWGVINSRYELVMDYQYLSVSYFTASETSWVSLFEGTVQLMEFMFE